MLSVLPAWYVFALLLVGGASLGSFLNVVIYRVPRRISFLSGRSKCPACGATIAWFDNLPLLSWILLGRRCRSCRAPIAWRYPLVEGICAGLALLCFLHFGPSLQALLYYLFLLALVAIAFIDAEHMIIPDSISLPFALIGLFTSAPWLPISLWDSILGLLIGAGSLFLVGLAYEKLRGIEGMGGGDVKLMAMVGAFLGWKAALLTIFLGSFTGALFGAYLLMRGYHGRSAVAFGTFLSPSAVVILFWGNSIWEGYRGLLAAG